MNILPAISDDWLPVIFLILMGVSMLVYAVLDGYDLGVGILLGNQNETDRDQMISSIGPFWDANETWLVLGVGILLVAFPKAHGVVLTTLYLPVSIMLAALILRGVSFDFRVKSAARYKPLWDRLFSFGSLVSALSQGYMLGQYIVGFSSGWAAVAFSLISAFCVAAAYTLIGAAWLIMKTEGTLQRFAVRSAQRALLLTAAGLVLVSIVNPLASDRIFQKWLEFPALLQLLPLPILTALIVWFLHKELRVQPRANDDYCWVPFGAALGIFCLSFSGLAYSFYPYVIPDQMTVWEAASAPDSLRLILLGCVIVLPAICLYTALSYWIFRGKATALSYE